MFTNKRYQLVSPIMGTIHDASSLKSGTKKCYNELLQSGAVNYKDFTVMDVDSFEMYKYAINNELVNQLNNKMIIQPAVQTAIIQANAAPINDSQNIKATIIEQKLPTRFDLIDINTGMRRVNRGQRRTVNQSVNTDKLALLEARIKKLEDKVFKDENDKLEDIILTEPKVIDKDIEKLSNKLGI